MEIEGKIRRLRKVYLQALLFPLSSLVELGIVYARNRWQKSLVVGKVDLKIFGRLPRCPGRKG